LCPSPPHTCRHRIVQIVTNTPDLQRYAAEQTLGKLQAGGAHEALVKVAGYILGEFGHLQQVPCTEYFALLQQRFPACSLPTKALLLSAYAKLVTHTTDISFAEQVKKVFQRYHAFADVELQQRSVEYFAMAQYHVDKLKEVLAPMPVFPERTSALERRVAGDAADQAQAPSTRVSMPAVVSQSLLAEPALPQAAPVPAQSAFDALDDLLMGSTAPAHPAPAAPMVGNTLGGLDDLLGLGPSQPAPPAQHITARAVPLQDPAVLLRALALKDKGVLWEDNHLQIGFTGDFSQHTGRIGLFLGNKHTAPLTRLRADLHGVDGLRVAMGALPPSVAAGQQATAQLNATCTAPFQQPPSLTVSYTLQDTQREVSFSVTLPLFVTKFLGPAPAMEKSQFYQGWSRLTGAQKLETAVLPGPSLASTSAWQNLLASIRLHVLPDVDPNPANVFAASVLCSESGQPLCVVRYESGQQKLTVASPNPSLAAAVKACIMPLIG
jgi:AP-2 complex subunit alpha